MPPRTHPPRLTHFLCIPLVTPTSRAQLQSSLNSLRDDVTIRRTPENPHGIPERAIRPVGTLHLTLGVMSLLTQEQVDSVVQVLESLDLRGMLSEQPRTSGENGIGSGVDVDASKDKTQATVSSHPKPKPLHITLRGITSMHAPSKTSVLYAQPLDEDRSLQSFCLNLRGAFAAAELLVPDTRPLLLHATIVNTVYVPGVRAEPGRSRARLTIDARDIVEKYEDFEWADVRPEKVAICKMGAERLEDGDEEYVVEGEVELP
jgi:activating signal cointegrator complex subunit 1